MMRARPDIEEDQRPEMHDREAVGINRPLGALRHEVIHHAEEARGEEEAHRVVAVPPLRHGVLDARIDHVALRAEKRYRNRQVVDDVQHGDGDDEGEIEPVRHVDMRLSPLGERADEDEEVDDPDDGQPQNDVPFGLGIFLGLGDPEQITRGGKHDEELIAPEYEPRRPPPGEPRAARALHHIERARDQDIAAKGEDDGRGVQRPEPAEAGPRQIEIEDGICELPGNHIADKETGQPPEHRGDDAGADHAVGISSLIARLLFLDDLSENIEEGESAAPRSTQPWKAIAGSLPAIARINPIKVHSAAAASAEKSEKAFHSSLSSIAAMV